MHNRKPDPGIFSCPLFLGRVSSSIFHYHTRGNQTCSNCVWSNRIILKNPRTFAPILYISIRPSLFLTHTRRPYVQMSWKISRQDSCKALGCCHWQRPLMWIFSQLILLQHSDFSISLLIAFAFSTVIAFLSKTNFESKWNKFWIKKQILNQNETSFE